MIKVVIMRKHASPCASCGGRGPHNGTGHPFTAPLSISIRRGFAFCELSAEAGESLVETARPTIFGGNRIAGEGGATYRVGDDMLVHQLDGSGDGYQWFWVANFFAEES
jgi:hypothetical protein